MNRSSSSHSNSHRSEYACNTYYLISEKLGCNRTIKKTCKRLQISNIIVQNIMRKEKRSRAILSQRYDFIGDLNLSSTLVEINRRSSLVVISDKLVGGDDFIRELICIFQRKYLSALNQQYPTNI